MHTFGKLAAALALVSCVSMFAATKTYQVTGPVTDVTGNSVTVQKGKEKWEIAKDASSKISGDLKKGDKVTIEYRMVATNVDVKATKGKK